MVAVGAHGHAEAFLEDRFRKMRCQIGPIVLKVAKVHVEIYEKPQFNEIDMFEALAHEFRHCWQIEKYYGEYYSRFKDATTFKWSCREQYHQQPAEIDAIAYALRFIQAFTGQPYSANTFYPRVNQEVEKYAESLDDSLFLSFEGMYKKIDLGLD